MNQPKKNPSSPTQAATPAPITTSTPSVPSADIATPSLPSESPDAKPDVTKSVDAMAERRKREQANAQEFIILIRSPRGTIHPLLNPKAGPGAIAVFNSADAAALALTTIPACLNNPSCIIPVEGL